MLISKALKAISCVVIILSFVSSLAASSEAKEKKQEQEQEQALVIRLC